MDEIQDGKNSLVPVETAATDNLPAILTGAETPEITERVRKFYFSTAEIFEAWVRWCHSAHTRRAYRADVMSFVAFTGLEWPQNSTEMLRRTISDVLDWRAQMLETGMAPKTILRRVSSLSAFYKYLSAAAAADYGSQSGTRSVCPSRLGRCP